MLSAGLALVVVGTCLAVIPSNSWPYVDGKLLVLVLGTLLVWAARPPADRGLVLVAGLWIGSLVLATVFGVDRWQSLAGQEGLGGGLILLVPCAVLLVGGAGLPPWARNRIPKWIAVTSVVVGATAISHHFWPNLLVKFFPYDTVSTSPMGHPIKLAALMGIAIVACVAWKPKIPAVGYAAVVVVTTALAFSTKRGGVIAALVGLGVLYWKTPDSRKRVLVVFGIFAVVFSGLTVADKVLPGVSLSSGSRFADVASEDSTKSRLLAQPALVGAFIDP
jgi:hypothetical protein